MERYTFLHQERWTIKGNGKLIQGESVDRLAAYENLELLPEQIQEKLALLNSSGASDPINKPWREVLNLPTRAVNALRFNASTKDLTVSQLANLKSWDIAGIRNIGEITRQKIVQELERFGFHGTDWSLTDY